MKHVFNCLCGFMLGLLGFSSCIPDRDLYGSPPATYKQSAEATDEDGQATEATDEDGNPAEGHCGAVDPEGRDADGQN